MVNGRDEMSEKQKKVRVAVALEPAVMKALSKFAANLHKEHGLRITDVQFFWDSRPISISEKSGYQLNGCSINLENVEYRG